MAQAINPINADLRLAQLLGEDVLFAQAPSGAAATPASPAPAASARTEFSGNPFEDLLTKAIDSLNAVSKAEAYTNQMVDNYVKGKAELQEVMVAQAKMGLMAQLAVTTVNSAVNTFKEITQMQI